VALNQLETHLIDFGDIFVNERKSRMITIENNGDFNFDYSIKKSPLLNYITVIPENGTVVKREKLDIEVQFAPLAEHKFKGPKPNRLTLSIISGPTYQFDLKGSARKPGVDLSFTSYDFGPCFVLKQPLSTTVYLEMRNRDNSAMSIESSFDKKPHLDFQLANGQVLLPIQLDKDKKETNVLRVPIVFTPREAIKYEEVNKIS
jgi:hydrocephalus-inducing protein